MEAELCSFPSMCLTNMRPFPVPPTFNKVVLDPPAPLFRSNKLEGLFDPIPTLPPCRIVILSAVSVSIANLLGLEEALYPQPVPKS